MLAAVAVAGPRFEQEHEPWADPERWAIAMDQHHPIQEMRMVTYTEDSGISSDDNFRLGESTSSEEEIQNGDGVAKDNPQRKKMYVFEGGEGRFVSISSSSSPDEPDLNYLSDSENGRLSPPLHEVELTASDEDDDGSVLELVIPMQSARYKRVPTSSPKKSKQKSIKKYLCGLLCCGCGRK